MYQIAVHCIAGNPTEHGIDCAQRVSGGVVAVDFAYSSIMRVFSIRGAGLSAMASGTTGNLLQKAVRVEQNAEKW